MSNLKINFDKSAAMGINMPMEQLSVLKSKFNFKWSDSHFKYLGTNILRDLKCTFELNFPPILSKVKELLAEWGKGLHSWFGRCSLIKMCILPKFLYLFQALPIRIPANYFKQIHSLFIKFVWSHSKPRLKRCYLTLPKHYGGLALPDAKHYYQAVHLGRIIDWNRHDKTKLWIQVENHQVNIPLKGAIWCYDKLPRDMTSHPNIGATLSVGLNILKNTSLTSKQSPLFPILGNPAFEPGLDYSNYETLWESGKDCASHYVEDDHWTSIQSLTNDNGGFQLSFWKAIRLHHFLYSIPELMRYKRDMTMLEEYCRGEGTLPQVLSKTYSLLNTPTEQPDLLFLQKWEQDLQCNFTAAQTQNILQLTLKSSICTKIQERNYKILTRWYYTPQLLHKFFPGTSDRCWRCGSEEGTLLHIFWTCSLVQQFWVAVETIVKKFTNHITQRDPAVFLLHATSAPIKSYKKSVVRHLLNAAKSCIPALWKQSTPPTVGMWLCRVEEIKKMEDLILTAQHKQDKHSRNWLSWNIYIFSDEGQTLLNS